MMPDIQKSIDAFKKLPGMGPRHATRCVFYLLKMGRGEFEDFVSALTEARSCSQICAACFRLFELRERVSEKIDSSETLCDICHDPRRTHETIMVVENDQDLIAIEHLNTYRGGYLVWRNAAKNEEAEKKSNLSDGQNINRILKKLKEGGAREIILATNPTIEGNSFAFRLKTELGDSSIKITRLARGLPTGAEIEYADEETLRDALEGRK